MTTIGEEAFYGCSGLTNIVIPNSVKKIGDRAFSGCTGLTNVEIPNSVREIGDSALPGCTGLTAPIYNNHCFVRLPQDYKGAYSVPQGITSIVGGAFSGCTGLTSIEIPNSVTEIGGFAFSHCTGLTSVEIPNSVTTIGEGAFCNCIGLTSIEIPNSVVEIGYLAFKGCDQLKIIRVDRSNPNYRTINGKLTFVVPEGTECISKESVRENTNRLHIPTSVTTIDINAIVAKDLKSIYIYHEHPENIKIVGDDEISEPVMLSECTLYVPVGTGYAYRHHPYFGKLCKEVKACKLPPYGEILPDDQ